VVGTGGTGTDITFEDWYRGEHARLLGLLTVVAGDPEEAREATAEAFTRALERWDRVGVMASPSGWTYRVGVNIVRRRLRRVSIERALLARRTPSPTPSALEPEVWAALRSLPVRQRTALALRYVCDMTQAGVAEVMGIAPGTVSATLTSARRRMAELLGPQSIEEEVPLG
jgi:RNA polymerase sigma-70 factor (ECF subfamily)